MGSSINFQGYIILLFAPKCVEYNMIFITYFKIIRFPYCHYNYSTLNTCGMSV